MKTIVKFFLFFLLLIPSNLFAQAGEGKSIFVSDVSDLTLQAAHAKDEFNKILLKLKRYDETLKEHEKSYEQIRKNYEIFQEQKDLLDESSQFVNTDRISDLINQLETSIEKCGEIIAEQGTMIKSLSGFRKDWSTIDENWKEWRNKFKNNKDIVETLYKEVQVDVLQVNNEITPVENALLNSQAEFAKIQVVLKEQKKLLAKSISEYKNDIFLKTADSFFSFNFWQSLSFNELNKAFDSLSTLISTKNFTNLTSSHYMAFLLHLLLFIIFFIVIKRLKAKEIEHEKIKKLVSLPVAAAFMLSSIFTIPYYGVTLPPLFRVILIIISSLSAIVLINAFIKDKWNRIFLDLLLVSYAVSKLLSIISFSEIAVRFSLVAFPLLIISLLIMRFFSISNRGEREKVLDEKVLSQVDSSTDSVGKRFSFVCLLSGVILLIVFIAVLLAQVLGYLSLSLYIFDATIRTVFTLVTAWLFCSLINGILYAIFNYSFLSRFKLVKDSSDYIVSKLNILICSFVSFLSLSFILYYWKIFSSYNKAANSILAFGFTFNDLTISLGKIFLAIFLFGAIISFSWLLCQFLNLEVYPKKNIQFGVRASFNRIIQYTLFFVATLVALIALGFNLQNLAVALGALGIGIGFGLQNIVNNFASGIILLFERPIKVGDVIEVNSQLAIVKKLGLRATIVETYNKTEVIVPNSLLAAEKVTNLTLSNRIVRSVIKIGVGYGSDVDEVTNLLKSIALKSELVLKTPEPSVVFADFGDSALQFELYYWSSIDDRIKAKHELNIEIIKSFRDSNINIPFPQRNLIIEGLDEILSKNKES